MSQLWEERKQGDMGSIRTRNVLTSKWRFEKLQTRMIEKLLGIVSVVYAKFLAGKSFPVYYTIDDLLVMTEVNADLWSVAVLLIWHVALKPIGFESVANLMSDRVTSSALRHVSWSRLKEANCLAEACW